MSENVRTLESVMTFSSQIAINILAPTIAKRTYLLSEFVFEQTIPRYTKHKT